MNALIKNHIFFLRWVLSAFCCFFSVSVLATSAVDPAQLGVKTNVSTAKTNASIANSPVFVFVDTKLDNYQALVKDIEDHRANKNITIVYLDPEQNGVQQITDSLTNQTDVAAVHLLTHGMAGSIQLGNTALNKSTIDLHAHQLTSWRKSLSANADILIYGCNVASTDTGVAFIKQFGDLTQAHVAASNNVTGAASFGADWNLESHYGNIQTNVIISSQTQKNWDSILAYSNYINIGAGGVDQTFTASSNVGTGFSYDSPGATYSVNRVTVSLKILSGADTSQNITLCLRSTWNGANLSSASIPTSRLTTSFAWYGFNVGATTLNDNQKYYIQIYTLSTDAKTVANTHNSSQWNNDTELMVGVTAYPSKELSFILSTGTNSTPTVSNAIPDQTGSENVAFSYTVASNAFADADTGDYLTYTATLSSNAALPAWLSFNTTTRAFSGTPTSGGTISVKVTASDGTASTNDTFDIVINTPPVVNAAISDQAAAEATAFSFQFASNTFTDTNGDTLTYTATLASNAALPAWLTFTAGTRTFSGTPANGDIGTISVKVTANDGMGGTVTDTFDIVISPAVHHYGIAVSSSPVTCLASEITITAYNSIGNPIVPANGTVITLSTTPATGSWMGGNTATFDGVLNNVTKFLRQTTAATLNVNVTDGSHSETASIDPDIVFAASGLTFYGSTGLIAMPNQVSGTTDSNPILKASCTSRVHTGGAITVGMAYECRNPTTCVSGQSFKLANQGVTPNANNAAISYSTGKSLTFDASGNAPLSLNYNDVGKVRLHAQVVLAASGNDPAITLTGTSSEFVVKPSTLVTSAVTTAGDVANPGGTTAAGAAAQFVTAGTAFKVYVEARTSGGAKTPNFGNEVASENDIRFVATGLSYPTGGTLTAVTGATTFTRTATPSTGEFLASSVVWDQAGSFTGQAELADGDYLGAGDLAKTTSGIIGRFYPHHFSFTSSTANSCVAGGFSYMDQPAITFNYTLQAEGATNTVLTNYGGNYDKVTLSYVAENSDGANGASMAYTLTRIGETSPPAWASGVVSVASTTKKFERQASGAPDGPLDSLQFGLVASTDNFDLLSLPSLDMNALTAGACAPCTAKKIGSPLKIRYGRLRLDGASGPETADMPVNFATEYWTGTNFALNASDSCTVVPLAAMTYPSGPSDVPATFTVALTAGTTTGVYGNSTGGIHFNAGKAGHYFSAPDLGGTGSFVVGINLSTLTWLTYDWNRDLNYSDVNLPNATYTFGAYRGRDRVLYWHERM